MSGRDDEIRSWQQRPLSRVRTLSILFLMTAMPVTIGFCAKGLFFWGCDVVTEVEGQQIHDRMTKAEVLAILGPPHFGVSIDSDDWEYRCDYPGWISDPLNIGFDAEGRVNWISR